MILLVGRSACLALNNVELTNTGERRQRLLHMHKIEHIQRNLPIGGTIETQMAVLYREVSLIEK